MSGYKRTTTTTRKDAGGKVVEIVEVTETMEELPILGKNPEEKSDPLDGDTSHWTGQKKNSLDDILPGLDEWLTKVRSAAKDYYGEK